jgi:hypothetical protein
MMEKDKDDASMQKYKESLIGPGAAVPFNAANPSRVIMHSLVLVSMGRPTVEVPMAALLREDDPPVIVIKEGATYQIGLKFYVQHEVVRVRVCSYIVCCAKCACICAVYVLRVRVITHCVLRVQVLGLKFKYHVKKYAMKVISDTCMVGLLSSDSLFVTALPAEPLLNPCPTLFTHPVSCCPPLPLLFLAVPDLLSAHPGGTLFITTTGGLLSTHHVRPVLPAARGAGAFRYDGEGQIRWDTRACMHRHTHA